MSKDHDASVVLVSQLSQLSPSDAAPFLSELRVRFETSRIFETDLDQDVFVSVVVLTRLASFDETAADAESCLRLLAEQATSPRELVLALEERLTSLDVGVIDGHDATASLVAALTTSLLRVKTKRPVQFVVSACEAVAQAINLERNAVQSASMIDAVSSFASTVWKSDWLISEREKSRDALLSLVFRQTAAIDLPTGITAWLTNRLYPQAHASAFERSAAWDILLQAADMLKGSAQSLVMVPLSDSDKERSSEEDAGAFLLSSLELVKGDRGIEVPKNMMRLVQHLQASLDTASDLPSAESGLVWVWYLILEHQDESLDWLLFPLVEMLTAFCATCPDEQQRFVAYRLLVETIDKAKGDDQLALLQGLLEECPFESVSIAAPAIIRELVLRGFNAKAEGKSLLISPLLLQTLGQGMLSIPPTSNSKTRDYMAEHGRLVTEKANLLLLVLSRDESNETGLRSSEVLRRVRSEFVEPVKALLSFNDASTIDDAKDLDVGLVRLAIDALDAKITTLLSAPA